MTFHSDSAMGFLKNIKVGDVVTRRLANSADCEMQIKVTAILEDRIVCGPWAFSNETGMELDADLGWTKNHSGSQLIRTVQPKVFKHKTNIWYCEKDNKYLAEVPELKGCVSFGDTFLEAAKNIEEAALAWLEDAQNHGDKIPIAEVQPKHATKVQCQRSPNGKHDRSYGGTCGWCGVTW